MKKNSTTIKEFVNRSIGEWKSIRSTHTLAFEEFENTYSSLSVSYLNLEDKEVNNILNSFNNKYIPSFALRISWKARTEWEPENELNDNQSILIFAPKSNNRGIIMKNKGYAELILSCSEYWIDEVNNLNILSEYNATISEEKIWFLSENVRTRYSVVKNKQHNSVIQTSHATEIKQIST